MIRLILLASFLAVAFGSILPRFDGRIVGGEDTTIEEFPHQISFRYYDEHWCGGSILDETTILTAAHCVEDLSVDRMSILAGSTNYDQIGKGQLVKVARYVHHPLWDQPGIKYDFDIALIKLKEALKINNVNMKKVKLPTKADNASTETGMGIVTGWGATKENSEYVPSKLQKVQLNMITRADCQDYFGGIKRISENMICAKTAGKDTCQGDSGGPLLANGKQIGIVSWGIGCARPLYPGMYTNVIQLLDWIEKNRN